MPLCSQTPELSLYYDYYRCLGNTFDIFNKIFPLTATKLDGNCEMTGNSNTLLCFITITWA